MGERVWGLGGRTRIAVSGEGGGLEPRGVEGFGEVGIACVKIIRWLQMHCP